MSNSFQGIKSAKLAIFHLALLIPCKEFDFFVPRNLHLKCFEYAITRICQKCASVFSKSYIQDFLKRTNLAFSFLFLKDRFCIQFFDLRQRPRTSLQCFALYKLCFKAKHCRDVLGRFLRTKNQIENPSLSKVRISKLY